MEQFSRFLAPQPPSLESLLPETAARLTELRNTARFSGLFEALLLMLTNQSFLRFYPIWNRKSVLANLWKGLDLVREYERVFGNDPAGCAAYVERMAGRKGAGEESTPLGEEEDVVRVLTVHSAKGLEFPITVVMDLNNKPGGGGGNASLTPSPLLGVGVSRRPEAWEDFTEEKTRGEHASETGSIVRFLEETEIREEWERLFYVAATRAMDCLVLCSPCPVKEGVPAPRAGSWLELLQAGDQEGGPHFEVPEESETEEPPRPMTPADGRERREGPSVPPPHPPGSFVERMSATSYSLFRYCPAAWRMKYRQGMEMIWELPSSEEAGGADLGSLAHWVLSRWDFRISSLGTLLGDELPLRLPQGLRAVWRDERGRAALRGWLERFARREAGLEFARLHDEGKLRREVPFRIRMEGGIHLVGAVDALWIEGGTLHIRDYKITAGEIDGSAAWETLYREQLLFYGYAASLAFPGLEQDIRLIRLREGLEGERIEPPASWEEAGEAIRTAASGCAAGPYTPAAQRCPKCFYRLDCPYRSGIEREATETSGKI